MNLRLCRPLFKKYGSRNENGDHLAQFAASYDLFLTNGMDLSLIKTLNGIKTIIIRLTTPNEHLTLLQQQIKTASTATLPLAP
jgi:hypothetical protein